MEETKNMDNTQEQKVESQTATEPTTQEDIFADIFGQQAEPIVATDSAEPNVTPQDETSDVPSTADPKSDPDQFQYWQSQADKKQAEIDELKGGK